MLGRYERGSQAVDAAEGEWREQPANNLQVSYLPSLSLHFRSALSLCRAYEEVLYPRFQELLHDQGDELFKLFIIANFDSAISKCSLTIFSECF